MLDSLTGWVTQGGYPAMAALMFLENLFPPIPSEVVMPLAGFAALHGDMNLPMVVLVGSAGSLAGAWFWYAIGRGIGAERLERWAGRHGRWLTLAPRDIARSGDWFGRHGGKAVLFGRLVPAMRTLISVPAGIARMPLGRFLIYSSVGTVVWTGALAWLGFGLGARHGLVAAWVDPASKILVAALLIGYLWRVATFKARTADAPASELSSPAEPRPAQSTPRPSAGSARRSSKPPRSSDASHPPG